MGCTTLKVIEQDPEINITNFGFGETKIVNTKFDTPCSMTEQAISGLNESVYIEFSVSNLPLLKTVTYQFKVEYDRPDGQHAVWYVNKTVLINGNSQVFGFTDSLKYMVGQYSNLKITPSVI